jgi:hypothetical protein
MGDPRPDATDTLTYFEQLGHLVDQRWTAQGRRADALAQIAVHALSELPVPDVLTPASVLGALAGGTGLPKQRKSSDPFGQPPAMMFRADDLEVQAITWMEGTTSIHQHGFDGAFRVTCGSSLHVRHSFTCEESVADAHLLAGRLELGEPEILGPGDVRPIVAGPDFIHALFHLERPSMTIVVRNDSSGLPFPQYDYRIPGLGVDALYPDDRLRMRIRGLHSLRQIDPEAALRVALEVARSQDLWTSFRVCDEWARAFGGGDHLDAMVDTVGRRHPSLAQLLGPVYLEEVRRGRLLARRGMLRESRHRLFLALIVNLSGRDSIQAAIAQAFPGEDPDTLLLQWVHELASSEYRGISGLSLGSDDLALLEQHLLGGSIDDAMDLVDERWKPPPLLENLFV